MRTNESGPPPRSQRTNRLAIAALISGVVFLFFWPWPLEIVAIILGHIAKREIRRTSEHGRRLATTGLTLGYVRLALIAYLFVAPGHLALQVVLFFGILPGCLIATMITMIYRQRRQAGS